MDERRRLNEPPFQAVYLLLGVAILVGAIRWLRDVGLPTVGKDADAGSRA